MPFRNLFYIICTSGDGVKPSLPFCRSYGKEYVMINCAGLLELFPLTNFM